jgi:hypothetical protein
MNSIFKLAPLVHQPADQHCSNGASPLGLQLSSLQDRLLAQSLSLVPALYTSRLEAALPIHKAIANEKDRLVRSIIRMQQENASSSSKRDISFTTSIDELGATSVVNKIGSEIRIGEPYTVLT